MHKTRLLIISSIVVWLMSAQVGFGADENNLCFLFNHLPYQVTVLPQNPETGSGTDIWLSSAQETIKLNSDFPGQNRGPYVQISPNGERFIITWFLYRSHQVQLLSYDSQTHLTRLLPLAHFKTAYPIHVIFTNNQPTTLLFIGNNSTNTDVFSYDLGNHHINNITKTPESEQRWHFTQTKKGISLETSTLHHRYKYQYQPSGQSHNKNTGIQCVEDTIINRQEESFQLDTREDVLPLNTLVGFGDSITWGTMRLDINNPDGDFYHPEWAYLKQLEAIMANGYGIINTINLGIPGNYTRDAVERLEQDFANVHAYFCLIMFGTNDVTEYTYDLDTTIANLEFIINTLRTNYHMYPIISTVPPQKNNLRYDPHYQAYKEITEELNTSIIALANRLGIPYVDTYTTFFTTTAYTWEDLLEPYKGNHPNPQGHLLIAGLFKDKILAVPPATPANVRIHEIGTYSALVQWEANQEFDVGSYRIQFGYTPNSLNRNVTTTNSYYHFIAPPNATSFGNKIYFKIQAVDKSGNSSGFSPVQTIEFL